MHGFMIKSMVSWLSGFALVLTVALPAFAVSGSGTSKKLTGGHTIGGPGVFDSSDPNGERIFDTDVPQPLCLTLESEKGTTEARFDGIPDLQVSDVEIGAVCRDARSTIELACLSGDCTTHWRVDTPEGEDEIQVNNVVNAPAGPPGPQGPEGPAGPQGPPGSIENAILDVIPVLGPEALAHDSAAVSTATCPNDRIVISAGWTDQFPEQNLLYVTEVLLIFPHQARITAVPVDNLSVRFTPIAYCAKIQ